MSLVTGHTLHAPMSGMNWAARRAWLLAVALASSVVAGEALSDAVLQPAVALYEAQHYSAARERFRELERARPPDARLDFHLGRIALWFDDQAEGLSRLERAAQLAPGEARILNALGDAYGLTAQKADLFSKFGWARKCLATYERAVAADPANAASRWSLMQYLILAPRIAGGSKPRAFAEAAEIGKLDPMGGRAALAAIHLVDKKHAAAFAQFEPVLREQPDNFLALYYTGRCSAISGERLDQGLAALRRCLGLTPPKGDGMPTYACVHYRISNILEKKGDHAGARAELAAAMKAHPDFRPAKIGMWL